MTDTIVKTFHSTVNYTICFLKAMYVVYTVNITLSYQLKKFV